MRLSNPAPGRRITSPYGPRIHPITGQVGRLHRGIDYGGTFDVLSAGDGIVHKVSYNGNKRTGGGHVVIIKHANDLYTVYYHGGHRTALRVGERVTAGQFVYKSGSTGASTGPHLHFETRKSARWGNTVDPKIYLTGSRPEQPTGDNPYKVSVTVKGRKSRASWKAWQTSLKARWGYTGILDGIPGKLTWSSVQRSVVEHGYKGPIDGIPGPMTRRAVQTKLKKLGLYSMRIDGIWGRGTWSAIQRGLNSGVM